MGLGQKHANKGLERGSALQKLLTKTGSLFVYASKDLFVIEALSIVTMYCAGACMPARNISSPAIHNTLSMFASYVTLALLWIYLFCQSLLLLLTCHRFSAVVIHWSVTRGRELATPVVIWGQYQISKLVETFPHLMLNPSQKICSMCRRKLYAMQNSTSSVLDLSGIVPHLADPSGVSHVIQDQCWKQNWRWATWWRPNRPHYAS